MINIIPFNIVDVHRAYSISQNIFLKILEPFTLQQFNNIIMPTKLILDSNGWKIEKLLVKQASLFKNYVLLLLFLYLIVIFISGNSSMDLCAFAFISV